MQIVFVGQHALKTVVRRIYLREADVLTYGSIAIVKPKLDGIIGEAVGKGETNKINYFYISALVKEVFVNMYYPIRFLRIKVKILLAGIRYQSYRKDSYEDHILDSQVRIPKR